MTPMDEVRALREHLQACIDQLKAAQKAYQMLSTSPQLSSSVRAAVIAAFAGVDWGVAGPQEEHR